MGSGFTFYSQCVNKCKHVVSKTKDNFNLPDKNNIQKNIQVKGCNLMIKKAEKSMSNINDGVAFILRGAKKRRSMAVASAKMINSDIGICAKLAALK